MTLKRLGMAASAALVVAMTTGCNGDSGRPQARVSAVDLDRDAGDAASKARAALAKGDGVAAVAAAERAVALVPASAEHRRLLGQAYLAAGRFASAASAFGDVVAIDAADGRARIGLALAQIALGQVEAARSSIAAAEGMPASDIGLALALVGEPDAAIAMLEGAVRGGGDARTRQNLAFAYGMAGRWREAVATASIDVPAGEVGRRIEGWLYASQPRGPADQVAAVLGVTPVLDPGLPNALALNQVPVVVPAAAEPVRVAVAEAPVPMTLAAPAGEVAASFAAAPVPVAVAQVEAAPKARLASMVRPAVAAISGGYVVQLGAFSNPARAGVAWKAAQKRVRGLKGQAPVGAGFGGDGLYRLAVGGFGTRAGAVALCGQVRAAGGGCFVRAVGEKPLQLASR